MWSVFIFKKGTLRQHLISSLYVLFFLSIFSSTRSTAFSQTPNQILQEKVKEYLEKTQGLSKKNPPQQKKGQQEKGQQEKGQQEKGQQENEQREEATSDEIDYVPLPPRPLPMINGDEVLIIPIHGTIDLGLPPFIERTLQKHSKADLIILDVDTFGGRVDAAVKIRDLLLKEKRTTIAFINRRAISAGALISFAADYIVFTNGATMGAATPIQMQSGAATSVGEKMVSYFRSEMRATAEANGWDGELAEAMVDADKKIPGVIVRGKLLTVTTTQALKWGLMNATINTMDELLAKLNMKKVKKSYAELTWSEEISRMVTDPAVSGILMSIGMLGIMIELYSPGVGLAGLVGFLSLLLFFAGHKIAGLAGGEEILLLILGLISLALEFFMFPGFGVAGIIGVVLIAAGLITSMDELPQGVSWDMSTFEDPLQIFVYALCSTIIALILIAKYLPKSSLGSWLVLKDKIGGDPLSTKTFTLENKEQTELSPNQDAHSSSESLSTQAQPIQSYKHLLGQEGVTTTPLRLSGKGRFQGGVLDIVSQDEYLERGTPVKIIEIEGVRIVVVSISHDTHS